MLLSPLNEIWSQVSQIIVLNSIEWNLRFLSSQTLKELKVQNFKIRFPTFLRNQTYYHPLSPTVIYRFSMKFCKAWKRQRRGTGKQEKFELFFFFPKVNKYWTIFIIFHCRFCFSWQTNNQNLRLPIFNSFSRTIWNQTVLSWTPILQN